MEISLIDITIRPIELRDNATIAKVIRDTLAEFGANHQGTVYYDPTTDHLYEMFQAPGSFYQVAELNGAVVGGGGIFPTEGLPADTCELVKMYLLPQVRGIGLGKKLISDCLEAARQRGYRNVYLETMPELKDALNTYAKFGFNYLKGPMGNSGHFGCELWMLKQIES